MDCGCDLKLQAGQHIFLVGIGGSGLSAIARVLLGQGYKVSGSDRNLNSLTDALERDGATIYKGHDAAQIKEADALIITSAVKDDHVEVAAAKAAGIPVYKRQDIMADLMEGKTVIAVAGTKGKTTTTSMIVHILKECGQDPSYIVGGIMGNTGTNAGVGKGDVFVVEADEYDNMFLGLKPDFAVITNIEWDHPDFFKTEADMVESFRRFASRVEKVLLISRDDALCQQLVDELEDQVFVLTYGKTNGNFWVENVSNDSNGYSTFELVQRGIKLSNHEPVLKREAVKLPLPGLHNILNAVAAYVVAMVQVPSAAKGQAIKALETFKPTARRFDLRADVKGIAIVDDYAHNPMSIKAVIEAAKQRYPDRAVWAVWQPHTYSRTRTLLGDFAEAFAAADHALITTIYPSRERYQTGDPDGNSIEAAVRGTHHPDVRYSGDLAATALLLRRELTVGAVVIIFSAGDAPKIGEMLLAEGG